MYGEGKGVPEDYKQAIIWYTKAAEQGFASAQAMIGFMYVQGKGVPQDYVKAHMWLNLSAASGDENASSGRDIVTKYMSDSQIAKAQTLARECLARNYQNC